MARKLPYLAFYTGDWMNDPGVRVCSLAARGLWIDMLSLMHESPRRGYLLLANGKPMSIEQLTRVVGCSVDEADRLQRELNDAGVYSSTTDGIILSRRMVRDEAKRQACSDAGKVGGGNPTFKGHPKGRRKGASKGSRKGSRKGGAKGSLKHPVVPVISGSPSNQILPVPVEEPVPEPVGCEPSGTGSPDSPPDKHRWLLRVTRLLADVFGLSGNDYQLQWPALRARALQFWALPDRDVATMEAVRLAESKYAGRVRPDNPKGLHSPLKAWEREMTGIYGKPSEALDDE